jgi:hypothetical protein
MPAQLLALSSLFIGQMLKTLNPEREICEPRTALGVEGFNLIHQSSPENTMKI